MKTRNYSFCSLCGRLMLFQYDFDEKCWKCAICGKELATPEERVWGEKGI